MENKQYNEAQLIFPAGGSKLSSTGILPPFGLIALGTYVKEKIPSTEIEVIDGAIYSQKNILENLKGDILGLSVTGANYLNSLEIAKKAKEKGMDVVVGGPHSTIEHKRILEENPFIDYAIRRDGEQALYKLLIGEKLDVIKNLTFRKGNQIIINNVEKLCEQINLNKLPNPNYDLLKSLDIYNQNFTNHLYYKQSYTRFVATESQKGCPKGDLAKRCTFCARIDKGLRRLTPENFWGRIRAVHDLNGKTMIWDFSDSFTGRLTKQDKWIEEVLEKKPKYLEDKVYFKIFARSDELDKKTTQVIKGLGVKEVFIGVESGDQEKLDLTNKGLKVRDSLKAVSNLKYVGIKTYASFIYGLPGEDKASLQKTINHMERIMQIGDIEGLGVRCMFLMPGMKIYNDLKKKVGKLPDDSIELQKIWIKEMTNTTYKEIVGFHKKAMGIAKKYGVRINDGRRLIFAD